MFNCINIIKQSINLKKKGFIVKKNKINLKILIAFTKINVIKFLKIKNNYLIVYTNYVNNKPVFNKIINFYKPSKKQFISFKNLVKIKSKHNWIFILSTNKGIINSFEAIKLNIGGLILAKILN